MDNNILSKMSYGLYILSTRHGDKVNGCIVDACAQVESNPDMIMISVMNSNYTKKLIKKSGVFCLAILDINCPFELIKNFGFRTGEDADKFLGLTTYEDINGVPYVTSHVCGAISANVLEKTNLGNHTVFIGEVVETKKLSDKAPMTYSYYQENVKPKSTYTNRKIIAWQCTVCGFIYDDPVLPNDYNCEVCGHPSSDFVPLYEM